MEIRRESQNARFAVPKPHDGVDCELGEVLLVLREEFGAERRSGDVHKILAEFFIVGAVVFGRGRQRLPRYVRRLS